jgi:hypothetical protein
MRWLLIAASVSFFVCLETTIHAATYECEAKVASSLSDEGVYRPYPNLPTNSTRFMIDKNSGAAVGDALPFSGLNWKLIERGSQSQSFKILGYQETEPVIAVTVLEYRPGPNKPFVVFDIQIGTTTTGICR